MTPGRCVAAVAPLIGAIWGCSASTEQNAEVTSISPATAFNEVAFPVTITGKAFRPIYRFDTMAAATQEESSSFSAALTPMGGAATDAIALSDVAWQAPDTITATAPAALPAGHYDVAVIDPRGVRVQLDDGFVSLGPDLDAPTVQVESPSVGSLIGAGATITVKVVADDGDGFLASVGATVTAMGVVITTLGCDESSAPHQAPCEDTFVAPIPSDDNATVIILPQATDKAGNDAPAVPSTFKLVPRPTLISLSPDSGPATGGTEIVVQGTNFILPVAGDGSQLLLDGRPIQLTSISATEIRAVMPRHDPVVGMVSVASGGAETEKKLRFQFIATPIPRYASPLTGPVTGGTRIAITGNDFRYPDTKIFIGGVPLGCMDYKSPVRIEGVVPAGLTPGPVWVVAVDDALGTKSSLRDPFVYEPVASDSPDGGADPGTCTGAP